MNHAARQPRRPQPPCRRQRGGAQCMLPIKTPSPTNPCCSWSVCFWLVQTQKMSPLLLVPLGVTPYAFGHAGLLYGATAVVTGVAMLYFAWRVWWPRHPDLGHAAGKRLFGFSILYLFLLFAALLVEQGLNVLPF